MIDHPQSEGFVKGKALDIFRKWTYFGFDTNVQGSVEIEDIQDSDIVVMTAEYHENLE